MSKLLVSIVQLFISLKLINGYKLCNLKMLNQMATMHLDLEENVVELKANLQEKTDEATVYSTQMTNALAQRDDAEKRCIAFDEIGRNVIKQLKLREAEIKLAASEILVLKKSQAEATDISKQLKEALDRWTS